MAACWETRRSGEEAWQSLSTRFGEPLKAYFCRRINDHAEAEDLAQEVFIRLLRRPNQHSENNIAAYVYTIASSVLTDWARHHISRKKGAHCGLPDGSSRVDLPAALIEDRSPERVLIAMDVLQNLTGALGELGERTRDIFTLSRLEGVSHRSIAESYGISISAVEKHVVKAVAHLISQNQRL